MNQNDIYDTQVQPRLREAYLAAEGADIPFLAISVLDLEGDHPKIALAKALGTKTPMLLMAIMEIVRNDDFAGDVLRLFAVHKLRQLLSDDVPTGPIQ